MSLLVWGSDTCGIHAFIDDIEDCRVIINRVQYSKMNNAEFLWAM